MKQLLAATLIVTGIQSGAYSQDSPKRQNEPVGSDKGRFSGDWVYRSFRNIPSKVDSDCSKTTSLIFGEGDMVLNDHGNGEISGEITFGPGMTLELKGNSSYGNPSSLRIQGAGLVTNNGKSEKWVYDYTGWLVPSWPNGENQIPAIVGSVIRTEHSGGSAKAGVSASFIAVKKVD